MRLYVKNARVSYPLSSLVGERNGIEIAIPDGHPLRYLGADRLMVTSEVIRTNAYYPEVRDCDVRKTECSLNLVATRHDGSVRTELPNTKRHIGDIASATVEDGEVVTRRVVYVDETLGIAIVEVKTGQMVWLDHAEGRSLSVEIVDLDSIGRGMIAAQEINSTMSIYIPGLESSVDQDDKTFVSPVIRQIESEF